MFGIFSHLDQTLGSAKFLGEVILLEELLVGSLEQTVAEGLLALNCSKTLCLWKAVGIVGGEIRTLPASRQERTETWWKFRLLWIALAKYYSITGSVRGAIRCCREKVRATAMARKNFELLQTEAAFFFFRLHQQKFGATQATQKLQGGMAGGPATGKRFIRPLQRNSRGARPFAQGGLKVWLATLLGYVGVGSGYAAGLFTSTTIA